MADPNIWSPENSSTVIRQVIEAMKGTSTTPNQIVSGTLFFTTQPDKFFNVGSWLLIVYTPNINNWITGQVISYDSTTGELFFNAQFGQFTTTAPLADWQITVSGSQAQATWTGGTVTGASTFSALATFNAGIIANKITLANAPVDPTDAVNKAYVDAMPWVPTGCIMPFTRSSLTPGWLLCDGQAVDRVTYAALFAYLDTAYGVGDGITTFNVPNLTRRVIVGVGGTATGTLGNLISSVGGAETHTLVIAEMPNHAHTGAVASNIYHGDTAVNLKWSGNTATDPTSAVGGNAAHNNMQPSMVLSYRIKT